MFCKNCGGQLKAGAKFCGQCGGEVVISSDVKNNSTTKPPQKSPINRKWLILGGVILFLALFVAGAILFYGQRQRNDERMFQEAVNQGRHYLEAMDLINAELAFLRAIEIDPRQVEPYLALADIYVEQDDFERAFAIIEEGLAILVEDAPRKELEQKQEAVREIYEQQQENEDEYEPVEDDEPANEQEQVEDVVAEEHPRFVWVLEPSIVADDINYVRLDPNPTSMNETMKHFFSHYAVIRRGETLSLIDNDGNILSDFQYNDVWHVDGHYLLSFVNTLERDGVIYRYHAFVGGEWMLSAEFPTEPWMARFHMHPTGVMIHLVGQPPQRTFLVERFYDIPTPMSGDYGIEFYDNPNWRDYVDAGKVVHAPIDWHGIQPIPFGIYYRGEMVTENIYDSMGSYSEGLLAVELNGRWGYIDKTGEIVIPIEYDASWTDFTTWWTSAGELGELADYFYHNVPFAYAASEGFVPLVRDGVWELRDVHGELVIEPGIFEAIRPVYQGRSWVKKNGLWGIIEIVRDDYEAIELQESNWLELFIQYIVDSYESAHSTVQANMVFALLFIEDGDIPALLINRAYTAGGMELVIYYNEEVVSNFLSWADVLYIPRENIFLYSGGRMGYFFDRVGTIRNGMVHFYYEGTWTDEPMRTTDPDPDILFTFYWESIEVPEEEYRRQLNRVFDFSRSVMGRYITAMEMIEKLETW